MKRFALAIILAAIALIAALAATLFIGRYVVVPLDVIGSLLPFANIPVDLSTQNLILQVRLPRALAAAAVGASLAVSGAAFQGVFRNPLVNPGLLGVSNGAGLGAAIAIVFMGGSLLIYPMAFIFGVIAVATSYWIARVYKTMPTIMLILGGMIVSSICSALISLMKYVADSATQLPGIVYWLMGSLSGVGWSDYWAFIPMGLGLIVLFATAWRIDVLSMGDKEAKSLGMDVNRNKSLIIGGATLATAGAVCISGVVGWIGLVIPHVGRILVGSNNRRLIPFSGVVGATFLVIVDTFARTLWASEIPLGVLTALIGAPFFVYLLKKTKGESW